jgi:hypothetical protein
MYRSTGTLLVDTKGFTLTVEEIAARLFSSTVEDEEAELTPPKGILMGILIRKNCLPVSDFRVLKPCRKPTWLR